MKFLKAYYPPEIDFVPDGEPLEVPLGGEANGKYDTSLRFPALFTLYFGGPDHYAHDAGMNGQTSAYTGYTDYFKKMTDAKIKEVIDKLKELDEFENKIFIITADHGHTPMPTDLTWEDVERVIDVNEFGESVTETTVQRPVDTLCKINLEKFVRKDKREAEYQNNNLHIGELAQVVNLFEKKVLGPEELKNLEGIALRLEDADIIAALNGPMAHIYVSSSDEKTKVKWKTLPNLERIKEVSEDFRKVLMEGNAYPFQLRKGVVPSRLIESIDKIFIRDNGEYFVYESDGQISVLNTLGDEYVDAVKRISSMNNLDRSGDIVLLFKFSTSNDIHDRFTSGVSCKSWHGSLNASDSYVPFIIGYPGGNKTEVNYLLKSDDVFGASMACDGNWRLPDVVKGIVEKQ